MEVRDDYLQCQGKLQQFLVAGSSVAEQLSVFRIPSDSLGVLLHCTRKVTWSWEESMQGVKPQPWNLRMINVTIIIMYKL